MENIMSSEILNINNLTMRFGGLTAIKEVSLKINKGELVAIIGPNGAGKTTLFNTITGIYSPTYGEVIFDGEIINKKKPNDITKNGIARTFQNIRLFKELTVLENVILARHTRIRYSFFDGLLKTQKYKIEEAKIKSDAIEMLKLFNLDSKIDLLSKNLPYGEQRKLEIARALFSKPKILLLDEPAAGMNPSETKELSELIKLLNKKFDTTIILIEHDMNMVMNIAQNIFVLNYGKLIASGSPNEIQSNQDVIAAYLGSTKND